MHTNSLSAFASLPLAKREHEVIAAIEALGRPATDRQIARKMGSEDPNRSRPRITHLLQLGILREAGHEKENGRTVRVVELTDESAWKLVP